MSAALELVQGVPIRLITRRDYHILAEAGVFAEGDRVELLEGVISPMTPQGSRHSKTIARLNSSLLPALLGRATVFVQAPFAASDISEPEPDLFVTSLDLGDEDEHPDSAYCVIEVAVSSLHRDRRKASLYAGAKVAQYILLDLSTRTARIYRDPNGTEYDREETVREGTPIVIDAFPDVCFDLADVLPKPAP